MAIIELRRRIKAQPDAVWSVVSDLAGFALTAPHIGRVEILEGAGRGLRRRVVDRRGRAWVETCTDWRDGESYTMSVADGGPRLIYRRFAWTCSVKPQDEHVTVELRLDYAPRLGVIGRLADRLRYRRRLEARQEALLDAWVAAIRSREDARRGTVDDILAAKGRDVFSIAPDATVAELSRLLRAKRIGCVLVLDEHGGPAGVLSERDVVTGLAAEGPAILGQTVDAIMTREVITCRPGDDMMQVMSLMTDRRIRHLPVLVGRRVVGLVSIGDVVKMRIAELETESESLKEYIAAGHWRDAFRRVGPAAGDFV